MLGNMYEWCQDSSDARKTGRKGININILNRSESIMETTPRLLWGGAFDFSPAGVRAAYVGWATPSFHGDGDGFRPARTYR